MQQSDSQRFDDLLDRFFADGLSDDEMIELMEIAEKVPERRQILAEQFRVDYLLSLLEQAKTEVLLTPDYPHQCKNDQTGEIDEEPEDYRETVFIDKKQNVKRHKKRIWAVLASCVLLLILLPMGAWRMGRTTSIPDSQLTYSAVPDEHKPESASLGRIVRLSNIRWTNYTSSFSEWNHVSRGERIRFETGSVEIVFDVGAHFVIEGPADICITDTKRMCVREGKIAARISKGGVGFTIETPSGTVVDRGTEFGLDVGGQGEAKVVVFKGEVDFFSAKDHVAPMKLYTGEGMFFHRDFPPKPVSMIESDYFLPAAISRPPVSPLRSVVITSVRDNIRDEQSKKFYEIVPDGFGEDVQAYVDRTHEWNGVTVDGLPDFLIGGDLVRTFNNDKFHSDMQLTVTLSEPSRVYVLLDRRSEVPDWLERDFALTKHLVGLDESVTPEKQEYYYNQLGFETPEERVPRNLRQRFVAGVGPGNSIDSIFSVWERKEISNGDVFLGGLTNPKDGQNFYGIVAIPANADGEVGKHNVGNKP